MRFHGQRTNKLLADLLKASIETVAAREKAALLLDVADRSTDIARANILRRSYGTALHLRIRGTKRVVSLSLVFGRCP
jgi:hypothetical protein